MQLSRQAIVDQARALLSEYGLADVTIRRIATQLGVTPAALYWHFPNKQALLAAVADSILDTIPHPNSPADLRTWANALYTACLDYRDGAEVILAALPTGHMHNSPLKTLSTLTTPTGAHLITLYTLSAAQYTQGLRENNTTAHPTDTPHDPDPTPLNTALDTILAGLAISSQ